MINCLELIFALFYAIFLNFKIYDKNFGDNVLKLFQQTKTDSLWWQWRIISLSTRICEISTR